MSSEATVFLIIKGIEGESTRIKDAIEVTSFSWQESQSGQTFQGESISAGTVEMSSVGITTTLSKASPKLMLNCAKGTFFKDGATLMCKKAVTDKDPYLKIVLTPVMISHYEVGASTGSLPTETFYLDFRKIEMEYKVESGGQAAGTIKGWYSLAKGEGG
jgi:type VI secretion system secreted protein Hcp